MLKRKCSIDNISTAYCKAILPIKPASHCPILKSLMALVLMNVIGCDSCLFTSHP